jgi:BirA family biotin operon repressor/biotin-[acetyl-CoA-carboxylase] ligase
LEEKISVNSFGTEKSNLDTEKIRLHLPYEIGDIYIKHETASTNDDAKQLAIDGAPDFTAVVAKRQTEGRGQSGRGFLSERGGLYISVIIRREIPAEKLQFITPLAGVAVMKTVEKISGIRPQIKWINDVLISGKKICGILTESRCKPNEKTLDFAVIGIGININNADFPPKLREIVTSLRAETGKNYDLNIAAEELLNTLYDEFSRFESGEFLDIYRENLIDKTKAQNLKF